MPPDPKRMSIIAVASQKGGVAKSTLAIHLAVEAVRKRKLRTVILELDKQGTAGLLWNQRRARTVRSGRPAEGRRCDPATATGAPRRIPATSRS